MALRRMGNRQALLEEEEVENILVRARATFYCPRSSKKCTGENTLGSRKRIDAIL